MLAEIHVQDLGVIADLTLVLQPGMTALTGETGAGKTLLVEAIELLLGERADPVLVRPGAGEARVEGRFLVPAGGGPAAVPEDIDEVVLARVVPRTGRSRAYVDGRLATAAELAETGRGLVDLHGQHAHQSLLSPRAQRQAVDQFGGVDLGPLAAARARVAEVETALAGLGGDARARAREIDLLGYQVAELEAAGLSDPAEEEQLEAEEELLAAAATSRQAGMDAYAAIRDDAGAADAVAAALGLVAGRRAFADIEPRLRSVAAELEVAAADLRQAAEAIVEDPERLDSVRARRRLLRELRRKYGERLSDVLEYGARARQRLAELHSHDERVEILEKERSVALAVVEETAAAVGRARREAAPRLSAAVETHLRQLALPRARFQVSVGDKEPSGSEVSFLLAANPGEAPLPLAKVASGGELARAMLALRLVLTDSPPTLVFDEVDAGIGGQAAVAVGRALAAVADDPAGGTGASRQVLVVTHLPQVAAFADHQVAVAKRERDGRSVAEARPLEGADRVVELSRMLSGQPASATAREHAEELLATARSQRRR